MNEDYSYLWPNVDEPTEIVRAYERETQLKPDDAQMHFDYGMAFMELGPGLEDRAIEAFRAAAQLRPAWAAAYSQLGLAYASANRREEAVEAYKKALALQPDDTDTLAALAHASLLLGRYEEAARSAARMADIAPLVSGSHFVLGLAQLLLKRYADADESFRRALQLEPDLAEARFGLGLASIALGNDSLVQVEYEALRNLDQNLAGKIAEHRHLGTFTPAEVVSVLFS